MKAALLTKPKNFDIIELPEPVAGDDEVLVKVIACGLCKSELDLWENAKLRFNYTPGFPGHEVVGKVAGMGKNIHDLEIGDVVTTIKFPGKGYAEYMVTSRNTYCKLPESINSQLILGEPVACAMNALKRYKVYPGDTVLFIGTGFMGNLLLKLLKRESNPLIIAADERAIALEKARQNGADIIINTKTDSLKKEIKRITQNEGVDLVIEAVGNQQALDMATDTVKIKGTIMIFGYHTGGKRVIDIQKWNWKGINIINAHERQENIYIDGMSRGIKLLEYGKLDFNLITHSFSINEINEAFNYMKKTPDDYIKGVIRF